MKNNELYQTYQPPSSPKFPCDRENVTNMHKKIFNGPFEVFISFIFSKRRENWKIVHYISLKQTSVIKKTKN